MNVSCGFSDSSLKTSNSRGKAFDWRHQEGPEFDVCAAVWWASRSGWRHVQDFVVSKEETGAVVVAVFLLDVLCSQNSNAA